MLDRGKYGKLRGRIKEVCGTQLMFAKAMGMDESTISLKLNGKAEWTRVEMARACEVLRLPLEEVHPYFFA